MIFDNHAYAQILENDTGLGAFEVPSRTLLPKMSFLNPGPT